MINVYDIIIYLQLDIEHSIYYRAYLQPHYACHAATYHVDVYLYIHIITNTYYYPACLCIVFRTKVLYENIVLLLHPHVDVPQYTLVVT